MQRLRTDLLGRQSFRPHAGIEKGHPFTLIRGLVQAGPIEQQQCLHAARTVLPNVWSRYAREIKNLIDQGLTRGIQCNHLFNNHPSTGFTSTIESGFSRILFDTLPWRT
jgi:hypothetical protein